MSQLQELFENVGLSPILNSNDRSFSIITRKGSESITVYFFGNCWLTLDLHLSIKYNGDAFHKPWEFLFLNAKLPGPGRFIQKKYNSFGIRADVLVTGNAPELSEAIKAALDSIEKARDFCIGSIGEGTVSSHIIPRHADKIRALCAKAEWDFIDKNDRCAIRLNVPAQVYHADVEEVKSGGYYIKVRIANVKVWETISKNALSNMLLSICNSIKMVRASSLVRADGAEHIYFEIYLRQDVSVLEIDLALSSLSVACQTVCNEVEVMKSEVVAGEYLACISWPLVKKKIKKKGVENHECNIIT
jgi:hypothetical protein